MTRINQILVIEKDAKNRGMEALSKAYAILQKDAPLKGISRTYTPRDDEGEELPPESQKVELRVEEIVRDMTTRLVRMFDVVATKERANQQASADVVVDNSVLLSDVPVQMLLFLDKQLTDLHTFVRKLPTLPSSARWEWDPTTGTYATTPARTTRTKKVPRNHVLAPATDRHPAQVQMFHEDQVVGYWSTTLYSGAVEVDRVRELVQRVEKLQAAVKQAREEANSAQVTDVEVGRKVLDFIFA